MECDVDELHGRAGSGELEPVRGQGRGNLRRIGKSEFDFAESSAKRRQVLGNTKPARIEISEMRSEGLYLSKIVRRNESGRFFSDVDESLREFVAHHWIEAAKRL